MANGERSNSLFVISTANVSSRQLEAETIDMFMYHPSNPSMRGCIIHPDLSCRYQNRVLIIYTLCTVLLSPVLVPLQLHNDKLSFISLHIKIPYLHDESPQQQKCNVLYVCNLHNGFCWWNTCWASITTSQTWNNKNTSTSGNPKLFKTKVKIYRLIFFFFFFFSFASAHSE